MTSCAIVVPIYRGMKGLTERQSFESSCRVCSRNTSVNLFIVTYSGLDLSEFNSIASAYGVGLNVKFFPESCFENIHSYNCLMLSTDFYRLFSDYDYLLVCQLDAILFRDNLIEWCEKGYDYIGAPLFAPGYSDSVEYAAVGNGGLSLRKVGTFLDILNKPLKLKELLSFRREYNPKYSFIKRTLYFLMLFWAGRNNRILGFFSHWVAEDIFYSYATMNTAHTLKVPSTLEAAYFAFDLGHEFWYETIGRQIPFGVHRWDINIDFWTEKVMAPCKNSQRISRSPENRIHAVPKAECR